MNTDSLSVIEQFKGNFSNCLILTFSASLNFFEKMLLNRLFHDGCYNNAVIMDGREYEQMLSSDSPFLKFHGQYYNCEAVHLNGSHHPKMIMLTGEKSGRLLIGSGNLNDSGYSKNLEIFSKFDYSADDTRSLSIFKDALQIAKELVPRFALSPAIQKNLTLLESSTPWLHEESPSSSTKLLSNLDAPILAQLRKSVPEADFDEVALLAPFFDSSLMALGEIINQFPAKQTRLVIPASRTNFPYNLYEQKFSSKVALYKVDKEKTSNRHCHAKAIYLRSGQTEYLLSGSPNISRAALLAPTSWGNLELAALCKAEDGSLSKVLSEITSYQRVRHKSEIDFLEIAEKEPQEKSKLRLQTAFLDQNHLNLTFDIHAEIKAEVVVNDCSLGEHLLSPGRILSLPFSPVGNSSPIVYLKSGDFVSNRMLISNTFIHVRSDLGSIARKASSLSQIIGQEFSQLILGFSPNINAVGVEDASKIHSITQVEIEEEGKEKVLPEDRFFTVVTNPVWENAVSELGGNIDYHYKNNLMEAIVSHLLFSFKPQNTAAIAESNHSSDNHAHRVEVDDASLAFNKLNKLVKDRSKKELQLAKEKVLDYEKTEDMVQYMPFLVASYAGYKTEEFYNVAITLDNYLEASTLSLERLWLEQKPEDLIVAGLPPQVATLSYLLPLSLALTDFNIWLLKRYPEAADNIHASLRKYSGIKASITATLKTFEVDIAKILSPERVQKVARLFSFISDYQPQSHAKTLESARQSFTEEESYKNICSDLLPCLEQRYDALYDDYQSTQAELGSGSGVGSILRRQVQHQDENELAAKLERLSNFINYPG